jgi:hypothetical protein
MSTDKNKKIKKNPGGRPPMYTSPDQIKDLIDRYFEDCKGTPLTDKEGNPVLTKWGQPVMIHSKPPTITGLALALGFNSRQSLLNYQDKPEFMDTITQAKARVEEYAESRLFDKDGANGAKFSLANNFKGWNEKNQTELTGPGGAGLKIVFENLNPPAVEEDDIEDDFEDDEA